MCDTNYWGDISVARFDHTELAGEPVSAGNWDDRDGLTDPVDL
jgi:hypothetical protein